MRYFLTTAKALLDVIRPILMNKRLSLLVILGVLVPAEAFAAKRVVDSRYIEFTGFHYFLWEQGSTFPPNAACVPVGNLRMKAPPYLDVLHCYCADFTRLGEQPNLQQPGDPPQSVLFQAYGDQDGDPMVCPWVAIPDGATSGAGMEGELEPGSETAAGEVPPQDPDVVGGCMSETINNCHAATAAQCAWKDANDPGGAPWQWCPPNPPPNTHPCREQYVQGEPFPRFVCN
jgi:hypothetical protein